MRCIKFYLKILKVLVKIPFKIVHFDNAINTINHISKSFSNNS